MNDVYRRFVVRLFGDPLPPRRNPTPQAVLEELVRIQARRIAELEAERDKWHRAHDQLFALL